MTCSRRNLEVLNYSRSPHIQPGIVRKAMNTQPQQPLSWYIQNRLLSRVTENNVLLVQPRHTGLPQQETVGGSTLLDLDAYLTQGSGRLITNCHAESPLRYEIYKSKNGLIRHNNVLCSCPDILTSCIRFSFNGRPLLSFGENTITG